MGSPIKPPDKEDWWNVPVDRRESIWLGLSVVFVALGMLMLGWRWGTSGPQKFLRTFGPGLVLCYLIWVLVVGAAGSTVPGAAIPIL